MKARRSVPLALGLALLVTLPLLAAGTVIPDSEAAKHVGETVSVKGVVAAVVVGRGTPPTSISESHTPTRFSRPSFTRRRGPVSRIPPSGRERRSR